MMNVIGLDLGGTKLSGAVFTETGEILFKEVNPIEKRQGHEVGALIKEQIEKLISFSKSSKGVKVQLRNPKSPPKK